ncbi:MAG: cytochrome C oxidase subunit III [Verrucomicrobia bacterium]|nr:MAG: cytochrome C oxidase subunit III [Verrucomicrobiota bacterium]
MPREEKTRPPEDSIREHTYDGIQEYNKRLPNWWLFTLYGSIVFSFFYWFYYHQTGVGSFDKEILARKMAVIEEAKEASQGQTLNDAGLWAMSTDAEAIAAGKATYEANCVACHLSSLRGKEESPTAIGPSLVDGEWIHGGNPSEVMTVIVEGVPAKGMLAWGSILGENRISEVTAYVLSHHTPPAE